MAELRERNSLSARALEMTILCATRTSETVGAEWSEFDLEARVWSIPGSRTKTGSPHKIPLSGRAIAIMKGLNRRNKRPFPLSTGAMAELLKGMRPGVTVHGTARSAFMDWCHETTSYPKTVIDMALGHKIPDRVEAAYRRGDLFTKRIKLMAQWAEYTARPDSSSVVAFHKGI
jgi:integrase